MDTDNYKMGEIVFTTYDLVFHSKDLIFGIYVGELTIPSFSVTGQSTVTCIYKLPDSVQTKESFDKFVKDVMDRSINTWQYFTYWDPAKIVKANECSKKEHLVLKVKHSGR